MESQVEQVQLVSISVATMYGVAASIIAALVTAVIYLYKVTEKKNDAITQLTKSFTEVTLGVKTGLDNNNQLLDKNNHLLDKLMDLVTRVESKK